MGSFRVPQTTPAKILRIHFCEGDKYDGKPLYQAIVAKCRVMKIAGATVFRGVEGYGETAEIHKHHVAARNQPIIIVVIDSDENIGRLKPVIEDMMDTAMVAVSDVEMIRVRKDEAAGNV
jgi:PII-like signaling protein